MSCLGFLHLNGQTALRMALSVPVLQGVTRLVIHLGHTGMTGVGGGGGEPDLRRG